MILLIDDDAAALDLRVLIFEHHALRVTATSNPAKARCLFAELRPAAVVMDLRMPAAEDGLALIREFRAAAPNLRLIVVSGWPADLDGREEAQMIDALFAKPVSPALLLQAVKATS